MDEQQMIEDQQFQDQFQDQYQQQEAWEDDYQQLQQQGDQMNNQTNQDIMTNGNGKGKKQKQKTEVFIGTKKNLKKGQVLQFDNNAYDMLHRLNSEWPSMSIDFIYRDSPFSPIPSPTAVTKYPLEVYTVQGSYSDTKSNQIYLTKWTKLHKTKYDDDPDVEGDQQDDQIGNDQDPEVVVQQIQTTYNVNRIRSLEGSPIVSFWNDQGQIHIMDLTKNYQKLKNGLGNKKKQQAKQIILQSQNQGFAINWNPNKIGQLVTGNMLGHIEVFQNNQNYTNWSKSMHYDYHKGSVQDIVFSPNQSTVFASCSSDGTIQIVDTRVGDFKKSQLMIRAHQKDVNVCDWNKISSNLIVSGSDDCTVKVWDLRKMKQKKGRSEQLLAFNWHTQPITSIRFQPNQQSVIAVSSQDNSITVWDMAVQNQQQDQQIPNQLMFIHQGQQQIKQIAFHPVYYQVLISTASDGINIWKPSYQLPQQQGSMKQDLSRPAVKQEQLDAYIQMMNKKAKKQE